MATPFGTNELNSLSRTFIVPQVADNVYKSNLITFRLLQRNKKLLQGGLWIEVPLMYASFNGGFYSGFDVLDISPSDTVKNAAFDWKQAFVPVTVDALTLIKANSPEAIVNFLTLQFEQAQMQLADILGNGVWSDVVSNNKSIDGLVGAIDDGTVAATYGGLARGSNPFWRSNVTAITPPLSLATMETMRLACTEGGRHPTIIACTSSVYGLYWALSTSGQAFPVQPGGVDEQLMQNGFTNAVFDQIPLAIDSKVPANQMFFINENYLTLYVSPMADFEFKEFREPVNQDAMTALVLWAGNVCLSNCARQGKLTGITS